MGMFRHPTPRPSNQMSVAAKRHENGETRLRFCSADSGSLKPPKPPDRPLVPYMRYSRKMWAKVRSENPESQLWDIGKVIGQMWRDASESEKAIYQQEYDFERQEYDKALKTYHNSTAYQQYLALKNRSKTSDKANTVGGVIAANSMSTTSSRGRMDTGGVVLQPVEDEELGDASFRRIAAVRFDRNHRLIVDLFNGSVVTDTRTILAQNRIDMLKKQATSLGLHQSKLEDELKRLEDVFQERKRAMKVASDEFAAKLKKVCDEKPQLKMDETRFTAMVDDWSVKLLKSYEEYKAKQEAMRAKQMVEREQLAEETPILYRLTVSDLSPSPKNKTADDEQPSQMNSTMQPGTSALSTQMHSQTSQEANEKSTTAQDTTLSPPVSEVPSDVPGPTCEKSSMSSIECIKRQ